MSKVRKEKSNNLNIMKLKRCMRRHHKDRMKKKAIKIFFGWEEAHKMADHLAFSSNIFFGNPRKHFGLKTLNELKFMLKYYEEIDEFDIKLTRGIIKKIRRLKQTK